MRRFGFHGLLGVLLRTDGVAQVRNERVVLVLLIDLLLVRLAIKTIGVIAVKTIGVVAAHVRIFLVDDRLVKRRLEHRRGLSFETLLELKLEVLSLFFALALLLNLVLRKRREAAALWGAGLGLHLLKVHRFDLPQAAPRPGRRRAPLHACLPGLGRILVPLRRSARPLAERHALASTPDPLLQALVELLQVHVVVPHGVQPLEDLFGVGRQAAGDAADDLRDEGARSEVVVVPMVGAFLQDAVDHRHEAE
mmetsp:Transcript_79816/g.231680  ORF Transcript_79816/g.231680 Transcript_79816/m.231680 type:complete len:251 (-) Transcript_79816:263-1015(-)